MLMILLAFLVLFFANGVRETDASCCCGCCCPCCCCKPIVIKLPPPPTKICPCCCCCCRPCCCCCCKPCCCCCGGGGGKRRKRDALAILTKKLSERGMSLSDVILPTHPQQQRDCEMSSQLGPLSSPSTCMCNQQQQSPQRAMPNPIQHNAALICNQIPPDQQGPLCAQLTQQQNQLLQQQKINAHLLNLHNQPRQILNHPIAAGGGGGGMSLGNNNNAIFNNHRADMGMGALGGGDACGPLGCGDHSNIMDCGAGNCPGGNCPGCVNCGGEGICGDGTCGGGGGGGAMNGINFDPHMQQGGGNSAGMGQMNAGNPCAQLCGGAGGAGRKRRSIAKRRTMTHVEPATEATSSSSSRQNLASTLDI